MKYRKGFFIHRRYETCLAEPSQFALTKPLLEMVARIEVRQDRIRIILRADRMREMIGQSESNNAHERIEGELKLDLPVSFKRRGVEMKLVTADDRNPFLAPDTKLIAVFAQGAIGLPISGKAGLDRLMNWPSDVVSIEPTSVG